MKKFALRLLLFAAIFLIYDKLFIIVARRSAEAEVDKRLEYLVRGEINKDIIIAGSSTGSRDILAARVEEETGHSIYNLCFPGSGVEFHEFVLNTLIEFNEAPRIVLLMVDDDVELINHPPLIFRKDRLYPLVQYPPIWKELARQENTAPFFSSFIVLQRLTKYNFDLRQKSFTPMDTVIACGSMPVSWKRDDLILEYGTGERIYDIEKEIPEKVEAFKGIIETCHANNIRLVLVFPPIFQAHSLSFENRIRQLAGEGVDYYVYNTENKNYRDEDYFNDETHLMRDGAMIFTDEIIQYLKSEITLQ
ncbi:MAG: hypothetical protein KAI08_02950 [Bacteroidales bacterium]|nr:hypothetical protein [Bacteroidales bacterium]